MTQDEMQKAYERLAMLHTETMAELVETQKRMRAMSGQWWPLFLHWLQIKLKLKDPYA